MKRSTEKITGRPARKITGKLWALAALITTGACLISCEKNVDFNLGDGAEKVVVEGTIESGLPPVIRFSKSIGFFSNIDLQTLSGTFLHEAVITVSDGTRTVTLKEYPVMFDSVTFYVYSVDTANPSAFNFRGEPGKTYALKIVYDGKTYESSTYLPPYLPLDSIWAMPPPPEEIPEDYPNSMLLYAQYTDPPEPGNKARYFTSTNGAAFLPPVYSVYDDEIVNGTSVQIQLSAGFNKMDSLDRKTYGYFYKGDTVVVKWCAIDDQVYDFWRTLEFSYGSTGNPFASPVEVSSNISNGALGVWQAYAVTYDTLIIPQ